ncbi:hypothetical protein ACFV2H_38340 [Streptomyces sp. NPDC059629]|uniref:hypothetical protein n=1 Tax=Streptomyces sp. NPDC059629 TaxID=3346889 RepID=UPI0036CAF76E
MATAPSPLRTTVGNLCLGSALDSWGIWFPEDERQVPYTRFLDELKQAGYTNPCLDTEHVAYGGGDNVELIRRFGERVGYVHIKQMDPEILAQVPAEDLGFGEAVKRGVCVSPPAGVPNPADVVAELAKLDAELFVIVEQDLYPCAPEVPLPIATSTREYLNGHGLSGTRHPNLNR